MEEEEEDLQTLSFVDDDDDVSSVHFKCFHFREWNKHTSYFLILHSTSLHNSLHKISNYCFLCL